MMPPNGHGYEPPLLPRPSYEEVHVWRAELDVDALDFAALEPALSADERARAQSFRRSRDRRRFIVGRAVLRDILSRYLHCSSSSLRFRYGRAGKPALAEMEGAAGIDFNLSHCEGLALYAVTGGRAVGIDLERIRPGFAEENIAELHFAAAEGSKLRRLPARLQVQAFFDCWVRKEAYAKALGGGLSLPWQHFEVSFLPGEPAALRQGADPRWSLMPLSPDAGFTAALVVEGHDWVLRRWQWNRQLGPAAGEGRALRAAKPCP